MTKPAAARETHFHLGVCVRALPQGWTLEMGEKRCRGQRGGGTKKLNTAGVFQLRTSPAVLKALDSSSHLRAYVARDSQRGPSPPTETTAVQYQCSLTQTKVSNKPLFPSFLSLSLSQMMAQE